MRARYRSYSDEDIILAVKQSLSKAGVLRLLGLAAKGGNYKTVDRAIARLSLDTEHFKGQAIHAGQKFAPKRPLSYYLAKGSLAQTDRLRRRLLSEGVFEHKCYRCGLTEWLDVKIPLELEHVDGDNENNELSNLTLLCPNCHALTPTYRGKNQKRARMAELVDADPLKGFTLNECAGSIPVSGTLVPKVERKTKIDWPLTEDLLRMVAESNYSRTARALGVSDNALRKRIKAYPVWKLI